MTANGRGRKLQARSDTERLDLLIKLIGYGRARSEVAIGWGGGDDHDGALELHAGPAGHFQDFIAEDAGGDLRALLDRALSKNAGATRRKKRRSRTT